MIKPLLLFVFVLTGCSHVNTQLKKIGISAPDRKDNYFFVRWNKNLDPIYESGNLPINLSGPFHYEGLVYQGDSAGFMRAYNAENGRVIWEHDEGEGFHAQAGLFDKNIIYGTVNGRVIARHYLTGDLAYAIDLGTSVESAPTFHKGRAIFHLRNHKLVVLDAKTGKVMWTYQRNVPFKTTLQRVSRPVIYDQKIYVGFADGNAVCLSFNDGQLIWEKKLATGSKFIDVDLTPEFHKGKLYIGSLAGQLNVLNPKTGALLRKFTFDAARAPYFDSKYALLGTLEGEFVILNENDEVVRIHKLGEYPITSIASWKNAWAIGTTEGKLYSVDKKTLEIKSVFDLGSYASAIFAPFEIAEDKLIVFSSRNRLYVFQ